MDDHKDTLRAGLQPGLGFVGAFDAVGLPAVGLIEKGSVSNGRWFELRLSDRIDSEGVAELGW